MSVETRFVKCPTCRKPTQWAATSPFRPFCSERCKLLDFGAWAGGDYAVGAEEEEPLPPGEQL